MIKTIGDLAKADPTFLRSYLGKWGSVLYAFARGEDASPVAAMGEEALIKSIGNNTTTSRDLTCDNDVMVVFYALSESVTARMREHGFRARTVQISVRDNALDSFERQGKLIKATNLSSEITTKAMELFQANYRWEKPIRSIGVRGTDLVGPSATEQLSLFDDKTRRAKAETLEITVDEIRRRFGHFAVQRAIMLQDKPLGGINAINV